MRVDKYGQVVCTDDDILTNLMIADTNRQYLIEDSTMDTTIVNELLEYTAFIEYIESDLDIKEYDKANQSQWNMPPFYKQMDIAEYILSLCNNEAELQRCADELFKYQDRDLFDLLRYLIYLVDKMKEHDIIWGVGRGSSVASYILYKLEIHRIDSMYYKLSIDEFLR